MWRKIRKDAGLTQEEMGKRTNCNKIRICQYENGYRKMPIRLQIEYLKLRNNAEDEAIIKFLEGELKNGEYFN